MSVEEVHVPGRVIIGDPKKIKEKGAPVETYYEKMTREARAKREYLTEEKMTREITDPEPSPAPAFQIRGGINLGELDLQAERREAAAAALEERKRQEGKVAKLEEQSNSLKEQLHQTELAHVTNLLSKQIEELGKRIASGAQPKTLGDQIAEIRQLAGALGLQAPAPGASDGMLTIELKKLEFQMQRESQAFERGKIVDERNYQLELRKLDQLYSQTQNQLQIEKEKLALWTSLPTQIGGVLAKAIVDGTRDKIASSNGTGEPIRKAAVSGYVNAKIGEAGEIPCPNPDCGQPVAIGPTARVAECAVCHTRVQIKRIVEKAEGVPVAVEDE